MDINYIGEHLIPGNIGYFSIALSFGMSILALVAYVFATFVKDDGVSWRNLGRLAFSIHGLAVFGIVISLFYIIHSHYFEYYYVWAHSSMELPVKYMISCFWEGQEGSFLLWTFWHVFIGAAIIFTAKKWESPVMISITMAQVALSSMLLGLEYFGAKIGSNPFILLRHAMEAPIFSDPHYLEKILDGNGLNPLLQNYWMVIHPPVLFLGFAASIVPFAFALAALIKRDYKNWVGQTLVWTTFTIGILGLGILMGGAWAYEALSFGGFWAWDPVENAVLVPWLFIAAGLHTLIIYKNTGNAIFSTMLMLMAGFILILYSTFLTRSGVLGESSVHSFTDLGLSGQLLLFLFGFIILAVVFLILRKKELPTNKIEEKATSREFWMFIGSLVLVVSGFQIIFSTSIPVFNTIFNAPWLDFIFKEEVNMAPPTDPISHYNKFQIPFAIAIALITAVTQYLKYKSTNLKSIIKKVLISLFIAVFISVLFIWHLHLTNPVFIVLLIASWYTVVGNFDVFIPYLRKKKKVLVGSSAIAHIGIGLILVGSLISNAKKEVISINTTGIDFGDNFEEKDKRENVYLPKGEPKIIGEYLVTYIGDSVVEPNHYYKVNYKKVDFETNKVLEEFTLLPNAQINPSMGGLISSPSTKHYLGKDLYTHVTSIDAETDNEKDYINTKNYKVKTKDTINYRGFDIVVGAIVVDPAAAEKFKELGDIIATSLPLKVYKNKKEYSVEPLFIINGNQLVRPAQDIEDLDLRFHFVNIDTENYDFEIAISQKNDKSPQFIIMKALVFPYINLLWLGSVLLFVGSIMAMWRRIKDLKRKK